MLLASLEPYAAIGVTIAVVIVVAAAILVIAHVIGPKKHHGPVKDSPYESAVRRRDHLLVAVGAGLLPRGQDGRDDSARGWYRGR